MFDFDVCLVGAGPVGIVLAEQISNNGFRVGVLESGAETPEASKRRLSNGRRSGLPYFRLSDARTRGIGGTSWRWGSHWPAQGGLRARRLDRIDFRPRGHVPHSGWPIGAEELDPWFEQAEARCGLALPLATAEPAPDLGGEIRTTWCSFAPPDAFRTSSGLGASSLVTFVTHANVVRMELDPDGRTVSSVRAGAPGGGWFTVTARTFVLAGGGIENARLLLASEFGRPGGLANPAGQVGRYFMEHLHVESGELRLAPGAAPPLDLYRRHLSSGWPVIGAFQVSPASQIARGLLNSTIELRARSPRFFSPGVRSLAEVAWAVGEAQVPPGLARHIRNIAVHPRDVAFALATRAVSQTGLIGGASALVLTAEQAPNPRSRITLAEKRDPFGVPLPHLHWQLSPIDTESIRATQDVLDSALRTAGVGRIIRKWGDAEPLPYVHGCRHHIGTTRMSEDASTGVVDRDCRVHGMANLFIAGSSVMPTAGAITVTMAALALSFRLADHLKRIAENSPIPA